MTIADFMYSICGDSGRFDFMFYIVAGIFFLVIIDMIFNLVVGGIWSLFK